MSTTKHSPPPKTPLSTQNIRRGIIIVAVLLILVMAAFSAVYYWDRFLPRGDQSPSEIAIQEAEKAVREHPQDPDLRLALARIYYENSLYPEALEHANQVLSVSPDSENALLIAGLANIRLAQAAAAIPPLEQLIAARKKNPMAKSDMLLEMAYYFVGESYNKLGQNENAIPPLEAALEITPTDAAHSTNWEWRTNLRSDAKPPRNPITRPCAWSPTLPKPIRAWRNATPFWMSRDAWNMPGECKPSG